MNITTKDLRKEPGKVLKRVARGQEFIITYRGKKIAKLVGLNSDSSSSTESVKDEIFGLWKNHDNRLSVDETVREMRKGRKF